MNTLKSALKIDNENPNETLNVDTIHTKTKSQITGTSMIHPQNPNENLNDIDMEIMGDDVTKSPYVPVYKHKYVSPFKSQSMATEFDCDNQLANANDSNDSIIDVDSSNENDEKELTDIKEDASEDEGEHFEYTDDDLDEALAEHDSHKTEADKRPSETNDEEPVTPINTAKSLEDSFDISEGHYLPMTPKKAILSSSASETSILAMDILNSIRNTTDIIEENPYIEMSSGLSNASEKQASPYELVMVSSKKDSNEPLYMELAQNSNNQLKKKPTSSDGKIPSKKRHPEKGSTRIKKRHDLPDILKQSQQNYIKSDDSSDADDEGVSKEPISMKSRTRFSLSDTFRPASYYLGASTSSSIHKNLPLAECLDSSDSEIVAPPPIPLSPPPPLDIDETFSSENVNTIKRNSTTSNEKIHQRTMSASSNPLSDRTMEANRLSRLSLQDQLFKQQQQHDSNASGYLNLPQFEKLKNAKLFSTASNCSINTDDGSNTSSDFDLYNKIKLQSPSISADSLNQSQLSLTESPKPARPRPLSDDSLFKFDDEQNANDKLDHYLNKLETSDLFFSKEQTTWLTENLKHMPGGSMDETLALHYENINLIEQQKKASMSTMYYDSLEDVSNKNTQDVSLQPLKEQNLSLHDALHDDDLANKNYSIETSTDHDGSSTIFELTQPSHSRNNSNLSDSAPYYYSDLASGMSDNTTHKLNNQRDVHAAKKNPNYISHIHNLINNSNKQQLTSILKDQAEKEQGIDSRNIYESGSGRLNKFVNKEEPTTSFANKIYYHEKNTNVEVNTSTAIDNLLYTSPKNENMDTSTTECDQLWEEDSIWRESLRRVSQRHARSLDDLDRIESISSAATKAARISDADRQWGIVKSPSSSVERKKTSRPKISRDVTYVNDEHFQRTLTKKKNIEPPKLDENDVYVQLACANAGPSDVYETLRDDSKASSYDIDRENIRQWDLMSSGLVKSSSICSRTTNRGSITGATIAQGSMETTTGDDQDIHLMSKSPKPSNYRAN